LSTAGDLCDAHCFVLKEMDHNIALLSDARIVAIPKGDLLELVDERAEVARSLWWSTLVDAAIAREWLVNIGQRDAYERLAHLFCEMWFRLRQVGLTQDGEFAFPLTQEQLADTQGLTAVHVNRMLQRMRGEGLISMANRHVTIHDIVALQRVAGFNPNYLHLDRRN
jgi:CRP-like cAMP-binding protein